MLTKDKPKYGFASFAQKHSSSYRSKPVQSKTGWVVGAKFKRLSDYHNGGQILTISRIEKHDIADLWQIYAEEDNLFNHRGFCTLVTE